MKNILNLVLTMCCMHFIYGMQGGENLYSGYSGTIVSYAGDLVGEDTWEDRIKGLPLDTSVLDFSESNYTAESMSRILKLKKLKVLNLSGCAFPDLAWNHVIKELPIKIEELDLSGTNWFGESAMHLNKYGSLKKMSLARLCLNGELWSKIFSSLPSNIENLDYSGSNFGMDPQRSLPSIKGVKVLNASDTYCNPLNQDIYDSIEELDMSDLKTRPCLVKDNPKAVRIGLYGSKLKKLSMRNMYIIGGSEGYFNIQNHQDGGLSIIAEILANNKSLEELDIRGVEIIIVDSNQSRIVHKYKVKGIDVTKMPSIKRSVNIICD